MIRNLSHVILFLWISIDTIFSQSENFKRANGLFLNFYSKLNNIHSDFVKTDSQRNDIKLSILDVVIKKNSKIFNNIDKKDDRKLQLDADSYLNKYIKFYSGNIDNNLTEILYDSLSSSLEANAIIYRFVYKVDVLKSNLNGKKDILRSDTISHYVGFIKVNGIDSLEYPRLFSTESYSTLNKHDLDSDNDGVPNFKDKCPNIKGLESLEGCPDADGDGISDINDKCPDKFGLKEFLGCPIVDRDNDGVADKDDKCPNTPGSLKNRGCPEINQNMVIEVPLNLERLNSIKSNWGLIKIRDGKQIIDKKTNVKVLEGTEEFVVLIKKIPNRWTKMIDYNIIVSQIKFKDGNSVNLKNIDLSIQYDETLNKFKPKSLILNLNEQREFYSYIINN